MITGKQMAAATIGAAALISAVLVIKASVNDFIEERIEESLTIKEIHAVVDSLDRAVTDLGWLDKIHDKSVPPGGHGQ